MNKHIALAAAMVLGAGFGFVVGNVDGFNKGSLSGYTEGYASGYAEGNISGRHEGDRLGYMRSVALHGDWIVARQGNDCVVLNPISRELEGRWRREGDVCRLSDLLKEYSPPWK